MTSKEKAQELVDKMYGDESDYMTACQAKQCALIAVDEIINTFYLPVTFGAKEYWKEVKQEIEKI